ncbi:hypothetical protein [uncultured Methanolobus sp.]|uniref:hypothetical protein n=1 Tax=uncultured Methanolobus sp. TaxID=218300 RepID=UPI0029C83480|nr:hypothetical protein [uncultured Methanolobus sp.]
MVIITECRQLHVNMPSSDYEKMLRNVELGRYLNVSDAARHYIRAVLQADEVKE